MSFHLWLVELPWRWWSSPIWIIFIPGIFQLHPIVSHHIRLYQIYVYACVCVYIHMYMYMYMYMYMHMHMYMYMYMYIVHRFPWLLANWFSFHSIFGPHTAVTTSQVTQESLAPRRALLAVQRRDVALEVCPQHPGSRDWTKVFTQEISNDSKGWIINRIDGYNSTVMI